MNKTIFALAFSVMPGLAFAQAAPPAAPENPAKGNVAAAPPTAPAAGGDATAPGAGPQAPAGNATAPVPGSGGAAAPTAAGSAVPGSTAPGSTAPGSTAPGSADPGTMRAATLAYNNGLAALKKGDWNSAGSFFGTAAQLTPSDAGALSFLGYVRLQQKRWDDALDALNRANAVGKDLDTKAKAQLQNNLGFAYWNKSDFPQAKAAFERALDLDKNYYDARYNLAFALLANNHWEEALPHLYQLARQNPKDASVQDGLGEALERSNKLSDSLGAYSRAVSLDPDNDIYRFKFALALVQSDRRTEALEQLRQLLKHDPANAPALLQVGDIHLKDNKWTDAAAALKRYVGLKESDFTGRFNLGVALDYSAQFDDALVQYARAEQLKPDDAATKNNVGRIYFKRGKYDDAVAKFREALKIDPGFADARTNLAIVLAAQGKVDDSNAEWQRLVDAAHLKIKNSANPDEKKLWSSRLATAYSGLAGNYMAQVHYADAEQEYDRLLHLSPDDQDALAGKGRALYQMQRYDEAEDAYRSIIKLNPNDANAWNDLGVVLEARQKRQQALDAYRQALQLKPDHAEAKSNLDRLTAHAAVG